VVNFFSFFITTSFYIPALNIIMRPLNITKLHYSLESFQIVNRKNHKLPFYDYLTAYAV